LTDKHYLNIEKMSCSEKEEILMNGIAKTIEITCMEYDLTYAEVIGCLNIIRGEYQQLYWDINNG